MAAHHHHCIAAVAPLCSASIDASPLALVLAASDVAPLDDESAARAIVVSVGGSVAVASLDAPPLIDAVDASVRLAVPDDASDTVVVD